MIEVRKHGIILEKTDLGFEKDGVLNPAAIREGEFVHVFYRAVSTGNYSTVGYYKTRDPLTVEFRQDTPVLFPQFEYESQGVEDPRITKIDDTFYLTYSAYDGINAMGAVAISKDLITFEKLGIITPQLNFDDFKRLAGSKKPLNKKYARFNDRHRRFTGTNKTVLVWDKNLIFFPRRIGGRLHFLHRIKPDIQIAAVENLQDLTKEYWENYLLHFDENTAITPKYNHEVSYVGGGCPPIETEHGWLIIYHGVYDTVRGYVYTACAALLDLENPWKVLARLPYPLFKPKEEWEITGEVSNVCFPTGAVQFDDTLYIYYGAADKRIACASVSFSALLEELLNHRSKT